MELRHLRYFVCVAEEMHFGRAAERLGISQPPLSQQIRALEEEIGVQLFERTSRRVALTESGRMFLPEARQVLAQVERAAQVARLTQRGELGRLGLGFTASAPFVPRVAQALYEFRQSHPQVELTLQELTRDEQIAGITHGKLDIGIVRSFDAPPLPIDMTLECLLEEEMLLALRKDHPLAQRNKDPAIADLASVPLVLYGAANGVGFNEHFFALCKDTGFEPSIALEVSSFATLLGLVAAGFGATILSQSLGRLQVENVILRPLSTPVTSRLWMLHKRDLSPTAQAFRRTIAQVAEMPTAER
jgi:DNA-binding transcriptional LysR family regulator